MVDETFECFETELITKVIRVRHVRMNWYYISAFTYIYMIAINGKCIWFKALCSK